MDQFWIDFGGFWEALGWILRDLGKVLGRFSMSGPPRCLAKRPNARGSVTPTRVELFLHSPYIVLLLEGLRPFLRRVRASRRVAPRKFIPLLVGSFFRTFSLFFAFFSHSYVSIAFLIDFFRFLIDFGRIWGGFWEGFGRIFRCFFDFFLKLPIL